MSATYNAYEVMCVAGLCQSKTICYCLVFACTVVRRLHRIHHRVVGEFCNAFRRHRCRLSIVVFMVIVYHQLRIRSHIL